MNWLGIILIIISISYLIYSVIYRNKATIYFKNIKIIEEKEKEYLKLQLYFSILNSLLVLGIGIVSVVYNLNTPYITLTPLLVHLLNFAMKLISKSKGYIEY